jgi:Flp pilus assembly protein TadG
VRLRGQELVEFALVLPVLFLFIYGVVDLGRVFHAYIAITNAAREGARYAIVSGFERETLNTAIDPVHRHYYLKTNDIISVTRNEAAEMGVNSTAASATIQCCAGMTCHSTYCNSGETLILRVDFTFRLLMASFLPQATIPLHARTEMLVPYTPLD